MADFKFRGDLAANKELVCSISRLLNVHGIPNLLWGDLVFNLYGVPLQVSVSTCPNCSLPYLTNLQDFSFVIPDDLIDKARNILEEAKFPLCHLGQTRHPAEPARSNPLRPLQHQAKRRPKKVVHS
jgi:hypothetical protein